MSQVLTGVGGNVTQSTSPTETVPVDGDALAAASVNPAFQKLLDYIALIFAGSFTGQTSASPGLQGTGGASAPGLKGVAGGGASPVKGQVNLSPTTNAPSAPDNGDLWVTTAGTLGVRLNGVVQSLITHLSPFLVRAWGLVTINSGPTAVLTYGTPNISAVTVSGSTVFVDLNTALANTNGVGVGRWFGSTTNDHLSPTGTTTTRITLSGLTSGGFHTFVSGDTMVFAYWNL